MKDISDYKNLISTINSMIDSILIEYKSIHPNVDIDDINMAIDSDRIELSPESETLYYIENGRKPGKFPPVGRMIEWASKRASLPRDINSLAYLAGRHVSLHGTDGDGEWEKTVDNALAEWQPKLEASLLLDFQQIEIQNIIRITK